MLLDSSLIEKVGWAKSTPFLMAAREEANKLMPLFNAMAEIIRDVDVDISSPQNQRANYPYVPWLRAGGPQIMRGEELAHAFVMKAQKMGSLIVSDVTFTWAETFQDYCLMQCDDKFTPYSQAGYYPALSGLEGADNMGFIQVTQGQPRYGDETTRISVPIKGLNQNFISADMVTPLASVLADLQDVYRLTNHDWLHHLTMELVNNRIVYSEADHANDQIMYEWDERCALAEKGSRYGNYESWCAAAHAALLQTEAAREMREELTDKTERIAKSLKKIAKGKVKLDASDAEIFSATNYIAHMAAECLTAVYSSDSDEVKGFLKQVKNLTGVKTEEEKELRAAIWSTAQDVFDNDALKVKDLRFALKASNDLSVLFSKASQGSEFVLKKPKEILGLCGCLISQHPL